MRLDLPMPVVAKTPTWLGKVSPRIRGETLPSHVGVFATTGMGKSNLMKVLAGQLLAARGRYALLLFDPPGEYLEGGAGRKGLAHHPWAAERLRVYSPNPRPGQGNLL